MNTLTYFLTFYIINCARELYLYILLSVQYDLYTIFWMQGPIYRFLSYEFTCIPEHILRESEKSPTCITRKESGASVLTRSLHTSARGNVNKKAYRVLV